MKRNFWLVAVTVLAACGGTETQGEDLTASCSGGKCDSAGFEVIRGGLWGACSVIPGATEDTVDCQIFSDGEVLAPYIITINGRDPAGVIVASGIFREEGDSFPATLSHDEYPLDLRVSVGFHSDHGIKGFTSTRLDYTVHLESAASLPDTNPLLLEQPFDIWPVQLATKDRLAVFDSTVSVSDHPFVGQDGSPRTFELRSSIALQAEELTVTLIAAPLGATSLAGKMRAGQALSAVETTLDGAGRFVATAEGFRRATDSDLDLFADAPVPTDPIVGPVEPEPTCTFDYMIWLNAFKPLIGTPDAAIHLEALECIPVGASEYEAWHQLFVETLAAGLPGPSSTLDAEETADIETVLLALPDSSDPVSYTLFLENFGVRYEQYMPQTSSSIDDNEALVLDLIAQARPQAIVSDAAYLLWFELYGEAFRGFVPGSSSILDDGEAAVLERIAALRPTAEGDTAYGPWFDTYGGFFDSFVPGPSSVLDTKEGAMLAVLRQIAPESTTVPNYQTWLRRFTDKFRQTNSSVDDGERNFLQALAGAKPCVDDANAATVARDEAAATVTASQDLFLELTNSSACEVQ